MTSPLGAPGGNRRGTIAVMQPYFMPYIGYWQLLAAVDRFIVLDDVSLIRRGWIQRNRILVGGAPHLFTLPLRGASQNRRICDLERVVDDVWLKKFQRQLAENYRRAPYFSETISLLQMVLSNPEPNLSRFLMAGLRATCRHLSIDTELLPSSGRYANESLAGQARIVDICRQEGAARYFNPPGGVDLYDRGAFEAQGVELRFVVPRETPYPQLGKSFVPWLSAIDILMNVGRDGMRAMLGNYDLI